MLVDLTVQKRDLQITRSGSETTECTRQSIFEQVTEHVMRLPERYVSLREDLKPYQTSLG